MQRSDKSPPTPLRGVLVHVASELGRTSKRFEIEVPPLWFSISRRLDASYSTSSKFNVARFLNILLITVIKRCEPISLALLVLDMALQGLATGRRNYQS